jgi:hypothetical protein
MKKSFETLLLPDQVKDAANWYCFASLEYMYLQLLTAPSSFSSPNPSSYLTDFHN